MDIPHPSSNLLEHLIAISRLAGLLRAACA